MAAYKLQDTDELFLVAMPEIVEAKGASLESEIKSWLLSAARVHVLDFAAVKTFEQSAYRQLVLYNQALKAAGKSLFCVNMSSSIQARLKADGLTSVFVVAASVEDAKRRAKGERATVDVEFLNPFITATRAVLETQAQTKLSPGKPYLRKPGEQIPMEIAGVLSLVSHEFRGSITICFRAETFLKIYENMVGEKHERITREMEDAAGELLNIIFGQAKTVLNDQRGHSFEKALPTVLVGDRLKLHHQSRTPAIVLPFESQAGAFHIEIVVDRN